MFSGALVCSDARSTKIPWSETWSYSEGICRTCHLLVIMWSISPSSIPSYIDIDWAALSLLQKGGDQVQSLGGPPGKEVYLNTTAQVLSFVFCVFTIE